MVLAMVMGKIESDVQECVFRERKTSCVMCEEGAKSWLCVGAAVVVVAVGLFNAGVVEVALW